MAGNERRQTGTDRQTKQKIFRRTLFLMALFGVLIFVPLAAKLYDIQIVNHDFYEEKAISQQTRDAPVSPARGTIYDRNGNVLAISATAHTLIISPKDVKENEFDIDLIADGLSELTGVARDTVAKRLERTGSQYEIIKSKMEPDMTEAVREFIIKNKLSGGVYLTPDSKRYYPYASLAAHVVGFVGSENTGRYGLEALYETDLAGKAGRVVTAKTGTGIELLYRYEDYIDAENGNNLELTIDATIQSIAERILAEGIKTFEVRKGGFCIVMDPNTGAILAMASSPEYDLNKPSTIGDPVVADFIAAMKDDPAVGEEEYLKALGAAQNNQWRNKAINDTYEPGSTFKAMVVAAALEEGVVDSNTSFHCTGSVSIAGHTIRCHKRDGHGSQNLAEAVEHSCNPAFISIGMRLGAERFYQYLEDYGFLNYTGIDLQGEGGSIIWSKKLFTSEEGLSSLAVASFGQTLKVTPIQLITASAAVINGGYLMKPYVLQTVRDADGNILKTTQPTQVRQVLSQQTSDMVRTILEGVVANKEGTGKNAYVAGYRVGGKTGTSEKRDETTGDNIVSFLGFAPADKPQIIVLLAYDSPTPAYPKSNYTAGGWYISGGNMGAIMAGKLIGDILEYLGVEKQYTAQEMSGADVIVPKVTGLSIGDAQDSLNTRGLDWRTVGQGDAVTAQIPAAGTAIPGGSKVVLYLGEQAPTEPVAVPNLTGYSPDAAREALASLGLYLRATGSVQYFTSQTVAASQSIQEGMMVERGTVIEVRFIESINDYARN